MNYVTPEHEGCTVWIKTTNPYDRSGPSLVKIAHVFDEGDGFIYHSFWGKDWPYKDQIDSQGFTKSKSTSPVTAYELMGIGEEADDYIPSRKPVVVNSLTGELKAFIVALLHGLLRRWEFKI